MKKPEVCDPKEEGEQGMRLEGLLDEDFHDGGDWTLLTLCSVGNDFPLLADLCQQTGADPPSSRQGTKPHERTFDPDLNKASGAGGSSWCWSSRVPSCAGWTHTSAHLSYDIDLQVGSDLDLGCSGHTADAFLAFRLLCLVANQYGHNSAAKGYL